MTGSKRSVQVVWLVLAVALITLTVTSPTLAALGKISGSVKDKATGDGLPGVNVLIEGTKLGATTDLKGRYFVLNVPPGTHRVTASIIGYTSETTEGVLVRSDVTTEVSFALEAVAVEVETPTVVIAERPLVDKTLTATRTSLGVEEINNTLPVDDIQGLIGTTASTFRGYLRGGRKYETKTLIDGINVADPYFSGGTGGGVYQTYTATRRSEEGEINAVGLNLSSIQELNVLAGTFNAEYDAATAGIVNVVTREGGQKLSGRFFFRSSLGGLDHAGPDVYIEPDKAGKTDWEKYRAERDVLLQDATKDSLAKRTQGKRFTFTGPDQYSYGEKPTYTGELSLSGPLTQKGGFYFTGKLFNSSGRFPNELSRTATGSLKLHYYPQDNIKMIGSLLVDDGGILGGWKNRNFTQRFKFFDQGNARKESLALTAYGIWTHALSPKTFYEVRVSQTNNTRRWGYSDDDGDGVVELEEDGDFIKINTKADFVKYFGKEGKGVRDDGTLTFFNTDPGNDVSNRTGFGTDQLAIDRPGFYYEELKTHFTNIKADLTSQVDFHHQIKVGGQWRRHTLSDFQQRTQVRAIFQPDFQFEETDYAVHPQEFGAYIQDRIEYEGVVINAGLRVDGFDVGANQFGNFFAPARQDTVAKGDGRLVRRLQDRTKDVPTKWSVNPRLGISHPISETATMHYAWGKFFQPPQFSQIFENFGVFANPSLPFVQDVAADPPEVTAYEMGLQVAFLQDYTADITAYYRDIENYGQVGYAINPIAGQGFGSYTYVTSGGYADSRGIEISIEKRPAKYLSGRATYAFSYIKQSINASAISPNKQSYAATSDALIPFEERRRFNTYELNVGGGGNALAGGFDRAHRITLTLLIGLPFGVNLNTITTAASGFFYSLATTATDLRGREIETGPWNVRTDLRAEKEFKAGGMNNTSVFFEVRNLFDRENILSFDNFNLDSVRLWEQSVKDWRDGKIDEPDPKGTLNRATTNDGVPIYDIARELYAGISYSFE